MPAPMIAVSTASLTRQRYTPTASIPKRTFDILVWYSVRSARCAGCTTTASSRSSPRRTSSAAPGVLEPGQDRLLAGRRRRPGDRPPRGLLLLGHGGAPADRPAPQRRHLQPRPPQPRADRRRSSRRWAASTSATTTSRRSPAPRWPRRSSTTCPPNMQRVIYGARRRRGHRHRDQDRAPHPPAAQDRLDPQGLPRPHRARGRRRRRPLLASSSSPTGPDEFVQVPFNDLDAMEEALRGGDVAAVLHRDDPRHLRLPAARARLPAGRQAAVRALRRALHRRRGADRADAHRRDVGHRQGRHRAGHHGHRQGDHRRDVPDRLLRRLARSARPG